MNVEVAEMSAELLDANEVAAMVNCSVRHVVRLSDSGQMPIPLKVGRLTRWRRVDITDWITSGCPTVERGMS